jgi:hypothetical protein
LWTDTTLLNPQSRREMAEFITLVKEQPECFRHSRFILGNPWKDEPYGYCCSDGQRAFVAINNAGWVERKFSLEPEVGWGLPRGKHWEIYRWFPRPARLLVNHEKPQISLGPFEVVLLEFVPAGSKSSLNRTWKDEDRPESSSAVSQELPITVSCADGCAAGPRTFTLRGTMPPLAGNSTLALTAEFSKQGRPCLTLWKPDLLVASVNEGLDSKNCLPAIDPRGGLYPSCWQTWRMNCQPNTKHRDFTIAVRSKLSEDVQIKWTARVIAG